LREADWDFQALESLIIDRGEKVLVERGISCPCRAEDVYGSMIEHHNRPATRLRYGCEQCGGLGYIFRDPICMLGIITGVESGRNRSLLEMGFAVPGDCVFSPSIHAREIQDFDKVTMSYPSPVSGGQIIMRNSAHLNDNALRTLGLEQHQDRLWYQADCVSWCEDDEGNLYTQGSDFTIEGKVINWDATGPRDGQMYTIKYSAFLEWIVYASPMTRFDQNRKLGQKALLRKVHLAAQNDFKFDTAEKRADEAESFTRTKV
jgi:hypothetical protein